MTSDFYPSRPPKGFTALTEEVSGVPADERFYIWKHGTGMLWNGSTKAAGEAWARENNVTIDYFESGEP